MWRTYCTSGLSVKNLTSGEFLTGDFGIREVILAYDPAYWIDVIFLHCFGDFFSHEVTFATFIQFWMLSFNLMLDTRFQLIKLREYHDYRNCKR